MAIQNARGMVNPTTSTTEYFWKYADNATALAAQSALNTAEGFPLVVGSKTITNCMQLRSSGSVYMYEPHGVARPAGPSRVTVNSAGTETAAVDRMIDEGGDPFDVVLIGFGQSNGVGWGGTPDGGIDTSGGAFALDQSDGLVDAAEPIPAPVPINAVGFGAAFARAWIGAGKVASGRRLLLVQCSFGNTSILTDWSESCGKYQRQRQRLMRALDYPGNTLIAVLSQLGETDAIASVSGAAYSAAYDAAIAAFRAEFGSVPLIVGAPADDFTTGTASEIKAAIIDTPNRLAQCASASVTGLATSDGTHFTSAAYRTLGATYATALDTLI